MTSLKIEQIADKMLTMHSFDFSSFKDAKETVSSQGGQCCFDKLSLCIYSHNLNSDEYFELGRILDSKYGKQFHKEDQKARREYATLFHLMETHEYYANMKITKKTRPDFELSGCKRIGIEVTRLTTDQDQVLATISRQNFGQGLSVEEIRKRAIKDHGSKADNYKYLDLDGTIAVGIESFDVSERHQQYADEIVKKYNLYKGQFHLYDEFAVLCDGQESTCLTTEKDSEAVLTLAKNRIPDMHGFTLHILRTNDDGQCEIDSFTV